MDKRHFRRAIFKHIKKSKLFFNTVEWISGYRDIRVQNSIHPKESKKDNSQIKEEKRLVRGYWHCGTFHYWRYGLPYLQLTEEEILDFVPTYYHHKKLERDHSGIDTVFYGDKLNQAFLFKERNLPTGEVVAFINGRNWLSFPSKQVVNIASVINHYIQNSNEKLFLKQTDGQGGYGIYVLKYLDNRFIVNGVENDLNAFLKQLPKNSYILQRGIVQSKQMMEINPSSLNTLRVVMQAEGALMKMKTCIIRMGRKGREVDNSAQGGVSVKVDTITGQVASTATAEHGGGIMTCHPDTGKAFADIKIEDWVELKKQIESIGTSLIDFRNIALDIAVTNTGALILEFNFRYGIEHQQCVLGGVRRILSIYPE